MNRCMMCRRLMVEVFADDADMPVHAKLWGWRDLKCGVEIDEPAAVPSLLSPTWLQWAPTPTRARAPRMIHLLHDGLRRRPAGEGSSPFGSSGQAYAGWGKPDSRASQRHWLA